MTPIHVMVSRHAAFYSPLIAAIAAGFLKEEGLEPTYSVATPSMSVLEAIDHGAIQVGQSAVSASWIPLERGQSLKVAHFAQINERDGFFLVGRKPEPDFTWDRLVTKQVLVDHGAQPLAMFKYALHKRGVRFESFRAINAGVPENMDRSFRREMGDYVHLQGPYAQQLEKDRIGYVVASVGEAIGPVAFSSLCAAREWLATDMAKAFMRAYRRARDYVNHTPAAAIAKAEAEFFPGIDEDVLAATIETYQHLGCWNPDLPIDPRLYETALDVFVHSGVITRRHPYYDVVAPPPGEG